VAGGPAKVVTASKYDFVHFTVTGTVTGSRTTYCDPPAAGDTEPGAAEVRARPD